jgi:hypothetical protein
MGWNTNLVEKAMELAYDGVNLLGEIACVHGCVGFLMLDQPNLGDRGQEEIAT